MTRILTIVLVFIGTIVFGQSVQFDTLRLEPGERFKELPSFEMNFPVIHSGNKQIDSLINTDLKNRFSDNEYATLSADSALIKWASHGIIYMNFEVTNNQNGILSLNISAEGCGAYCTSWTDYFNYSTKTGTWLDINTVVDTTGLFRKMVIEDKAEQYDKARLELKEALNDPDWGLTEDEYDSVLEYYNECDNSFNLNQYALYLDSIEIIEECWLPHVMKPLTPIIELKYGFSEIGEYLKIKN